MVLPVHGGRSRGASLDPLREALGRLGAGSWQVDVVLVTPSRLDAREAEGPGGPVAAFPWGTDGFRCLVILVSFWNMPRGRGPCPLPLRPLHAPSSAPLAGLPGGQSAPSPRHSPGEVAGQPRLRSHPRGRGRDLKPSVFQVWS